MKIYVKQNELVNSTITSDSMMNRLYDSNHLLITTYCYKLFDELVNHPQILFMHPECKREEFVNSSLSYGILNIPLDKVKEQADSWGDDTYVILTNLRYEFLNFPKAVMMIANPKILGSLYRKKIIDDYLAE